MTEIIQQKQKLPIDFNPALTQDKLEIVANIINEARSKCLEEYIEEEGDTPWSFGCRAREWTRRAIRSAILSHSFLKIVKDSGQTFIFSINNIPVQFYKDDIQNPSIRVKKQNEEESQQLKLFNLEFENIDDPISTMWRFVIETNPSDLSVMNISFIGLDKNQIFCSYDIPLQDQLETSYTPHDFEIKEGKELPPAIAREKQKEEIVRKGEMLNAG